MVAMDIALCLMTVSTFSSCYSAVIVFLIVSQCWELNHSGHLLFLNCLYVLDVWLISSYAYHTHSTSGIIDTLKLQGMDLLNPSKAFLIYAALLVLDLVEGNEDYVLVTCSNLQMQTWWRTLMQTEQLSETTIFGIPWWAIIEQVWRIIFSDVGLFNLAISSTWRSQY